MPNILDFTAYGNVAEAVASLAKNTADGSSLKNRVNKYGEPTIAAIAPTRHQFMAEGSLIYASTGTTVAGGSTETTNLYPLVTTWSDTSPWLYIFNPEPAGGRSLWLNHVKQVVSTVPASTTQCRWLGQYDLGQRTFTTDNTATLTPRTNPLYPAVLVSPIIKLQNTATASAITGRTAAGFEFGLGAMGGLPVIGDELRIDFGQDGASGRMTTVGGIQTGVGPPVIIPPGWSYTLYQWFVSNAVTPPIFFTEVTMFAR